MVKELNLIYVCLPESRLASPLAITHLLFRWEVQFESNAIFVRIDVHGPSLQVRYHMNFQVTPWSTFLYENPNTPSDTRKIFCPNWTENFVVIFYILLTVHLGMILVNNQLDPLPLMYLFYLSTCFEQHSVHHQEINCINTLTAIVDLSRFNNSCLKSPASTLVYLTFQSRALRSFSLNQLRNLSL